ncbi:DUF4193 family protein [Rhodococcus sp. JS3073]|nr:DUF4193 family protein [Rhodococcus sp. JS3073]WAM15455.1 DUF4193 family protein [Rhodococcus sp. JS3073]
MQPVVGGVDSKFTVLSRLGEFTCTSRVLVHHHSRLAVNEQRICRACV